jgi:transcriptional regulator with XRE-family HTH domain
MTQLREARIRRGWSQSELIAHLRAAARTTGRQLPADGTLRSMISRWEAGQHEPGALYSHLFAAVYEAGEATGAAEGIALRSHQFIPAWLGADRAQNLVIEHGMTPDSSDWMERHRCQTSSPAPESTCDLYVWPHGVAIFHVVDERSFSSLAALALWREQTYDERLAWATAQLQPALADARAAYVFSLYRLIAPAWSSRDQESAMRIMCMPRVLLARRDHDNDDGVKHAHAQARVAEDALLATGWDHPGIRSFGVAGTSSGYASWSGVLYHPHSTSRALNEDQLVAYELTLQAMWAYCAHLNDQIEQGRDPRVPGEWGWRFLRAMRCRLANPRPQESGQHRSMREAILETSGLMGHLDHAIEALRETAN